MFLRNPSIIEVIRPLVGKAQYRLGATLSDAPFFFDCSSLVQWAFEEALGLYVPRFTPNLVLRGQAIHLADISAGDLLFTTGRADKYNFHPPHMREGVGHVGIITHERTVICALWPTGVTEISLEQLLAEREFRAVRRIRSVRNS